MAEPGRQMWPCEYGCGKDWTSELAATYCCDPDEDDGRGRE